MPYDNNTPLATDTIAATQQPIHDNYADIETLINVNHVGFNVADQGKHKFVTMPVQVADPATLANEVALYSKTSALTAVPELFVRKQNNGVVTEITSSLGATPGWAFTSSGMLLKWGQLTALAADYPVGTNFLFPVAATIPVFGTIFTVYVTVIGAGAADTNTWATLKATTTTDITVAGSQRTAAVGANTVFNYLAVGIL